MKTKGKCGDCVYFCQTDENDGYCDHPNNEDKHGILSRFQSCGWFRCSIRRAESEGIDE